MDTLTVTRKISEALDANEFARAEELIDSHNIYLGVDPEWDDTPLHRAACANAPDIIRKLVRKRIPVDTEIVGSETPLRTAIVCNSDEAVAALLELGADPNGRKRFERNFQSTQAMDWICQTSEA